LKTQRTPRISSFEAVSNLSLLDDNIRHIEFELDRGRTSYFRVARESHLALLRTMVEALRGTDNSSIIGRRAKNHSTFYQTAGAPWQEIHREPVVGCRRAWRFSQPKAIPPPSASLKTTPTPTRKEYLIAFYDLLAMVQADCFMSRTFGARHANVNDQDLQEIEWLHENVRNEFEHYIPKAYYVDRKSLLTASHIALRLTFWLLRESRSIIGANIPRGVASRLHRVVRSIGGLIP
jgi:hypothetical protein